MLIQLAACSTTPYLGNPAKRAFKLAASKGFTLERVPAGPFVVTTFHKGLDLASDLVMVYIEGDGRAWITRRRLSQDPTPRNPVGLHLAVQDPWPSVVYVARPCQYTNERTPACDPVYWSSHRFAQVVVDALDHVLTQLVDTTNRRTLGLVGYSGGGSIAALIAAQRRDVQWLMTVAGNLDHARWTRLHQVTPLSGSLNPVDFAETLAALPQIHLAGAHDDIVPLEVSEAFMRRLLPANAARLVVVPEYDHHCCWAQDWTTLLGKYRPGMIVH